MRTSFDDSTTQALKIKRIFMALFDGLEISRDTLDQAKPVFNTAKLTLFQLSAAEAAAAAEAAKAALQRKIDELLAQGKTLDDIMNLLV
jgi:hypothetical protein